MIVAAGIALAVIGGLASFYYATTVGNTITVLVTSADVARGEEITSADLTTIQIAGGQSTPAYRANQSTDVIGQIATVDMPAGTLVTTANTGDTLAIENGQAVVGVALTQSQMPSFPLAAGDQVRIVDTPISQGDPPATTPATIEATVFTTKYDPEQGVYVVDLIVPTSQAADLAARSATGRIALILDAQG